MAHITVLGGTGYAGNNIVSVAAQRGHQVVAYSRHQPKDPVKGVEYRTGDLTDPSVRDAALSSADVLVLALSPRGDLAGTGKLRHLYQDLAKLASAKGVRLAVVGGAGSLLTTEGGPALSETPGFPDAFQAEAHEMADILADLRASDERLDWFFLSPAANFGAQNPGKATGNYRLGGDVLLVDEHGDSNISGADLALALVKEIEQPAHRRQRFSIAY